MAWNKVIYADCMNEVNGLPTILSKSIDLCFTAPPFNVGFKGKGWGTHKTSAYKDNNIAYKKFCISWFQEIERICDGIIIFCGNMNLHMWHEIKKPRDLIIHYKPNTRSIASMAYLGVYDSIICYGRFKRKFKQNVIKQKREYQNIKVHTCPGNFHLYERMLGELQPTSVIDPFIGSGTTAEACTKLGIKWLGYEINKKYSEDINNRLRNVKKEPKQMILS